MVGVSLLAQNQVVIFSGIRSSRLRGLFPSLTTQGGCSDPGVGTQSNGTRHGDPDARLRSLMRAGAHGLGPHGPPPANLVAPFKPTEPLDICSSFRVTSQRAKNPKTTIRIRETVCIFFRQEIINTI